MNRRVRSMLSLSIVSLLLVVGLSAGCEQRVVKTTGLGSDRAYPTRHESHSDDTFSDWFRGEDDSKP